MKSFSIIVCLLATAYADDGQLPSSHMEHAFSHAGRAIITLSIEHTFPANGRALGLDISENPSGPETSVCGVNNVDGKVYFYNAYSGTPAGSIDLSPSNTSCFGAVFCTGGPWDEYIYTNDWGSNDLFYSSNWGTTWSNVFDPSFTSGRGMDYDGDHFWTTNGSGSIIRFYPEYSPFDTFSVPETSGQLSGLTVFPYEGDLAVAVTSYGAEGIWFYIFDGTDLEYMGFGQFPITAYNSYGLAHSNNLNGIFWSYEETPGNRQISRLSFEISQSFHQSTWGGVKSAF